MTKSTPSHRTNTTYQRGTLQLDAQKVKEELSGLTEAQRAKVLQTVERASRQARGPSFKVVTSETGGLTIMYDGTTEGAGLSNGAIIALLMADMGTADTRFFDGMLDGIARFETGGDDSKSTMANFLVSVVRAVQPKDELEAMLAVQMGAVHAATMMMARQLTRTQTLPQQDAAERAMNKLARTYTTQMETLKRYRSKGEQRVIVERVTVHEGGQAIVGAVRHGGRGTNETGHQPHAPCSPLE